MNVPGVSFITNHSFNESPMYIYHYDFDNSHHTCNMEVEIEYDIIPAETHYADYRHVTSAGYIDLLNVRVYAMEGYYQTNYRKLRKDIDESWHEELDALAYELVQNEIDENGYLQSALWDFAANEGEW